VLAYQEFQPTKSWALKREAAIKKLSKRRKEAMIAAGT
jgi:predicted GIY-YIG superfamily endonuclease